MGGLGDARKSCNYPFALCVVSRFGNTDGLLQLNIFEKENKRVILGKNDASRGVASHVRFRDTAMPLTLGCFHSRMAGQETNLPIR